MITGVLVDVYNDDWSFRPLKTTYVNTPRSYITRVGILVQSHACTVMTIKDENILADLGGCSTRISVHLPGQVSWFFFLRHDFSTALLVVSSTSFISSNYLNKNPKFFSQLTWLRRNKEIVIAITYMVTLMRHLHYRCCWPYTATKMQEITYKCTVATSAQLGRGSNMLCIPDGFILLLFLGF